jgi:hypothetical protein
MSGFQRAAVDSVGTRIVMVTGLLGSEKGQIYRVQLTAEGKKTLFPPVKGIRNGMRYGAVRRILYFVSYSFLSAV